LEVVEFLTLKKKKIIIFCRLKISSLRNLTRHTGKGFSCFVLVWFFVCFNLKVISPINILYPNMLRMPWKVPLTTFYFSLYQFSILEDSKREIVKA